MKNHRASEPESKRASYNESRGATVFGAKGKVAQEPRSKRARSKDFSNIREQESKEHNNLVFEIRASRGREVEKKRDTQTRRDRPTYGRIRTYARARIHVQAHASIYKRE